MEFFDSSTQQDALLYAICATEDRGNILRATRDIAAGELIFREVPFIWHSNHVKFDFACHYCGRFVRDRLGKPRVALVHCCYSDKCRAVYCSEECREGSKANGHRFVCNNKAIALVEYLEDVARMDHIGSLLRHVGVALVAYCRIAETCFRSCFENGEEGDYASDTSTGSAAFNVSPVESANQLLSGFQRSDFCRSIHALRTGKLDVDEELFESMIAPAYFASYLEAPLNMIRDIFSAPEPWGGAGEIGQARSSSFLSSEILSELFFRQLNGTFLCNNLEVKIYYQETAEEIAAAAAAAAAIEGTVDTSSRTTAAAVGAAVVDDMVITGTGLNTVYSKSNHSCSTNMVTRCGTQAEVFVYAGREIMAGEEICSTYLHGSQDIPYKARRAALMQYLFTCRCPKCVVDEANYLRSKAAGEESSDNDDY